MVYGGGGGGDFAGWCGEAAWLVRGSCLVSAGGKKGRRVARAGEWTRVGCHRQHRKVGAPRPNRRILFFSSAILPVPSAGPEVRTISLAGNVQAHAASEGAESGVRKKVRLPKRKSGCMAEMDRRRRTTELVPTASSGRQWRTEKNQTSHETGGEGKARAWCQVKEGKEKTKSTHYKAKRRLPLKKARWHASPWRTPAAPLTRPWP